MDPAVSGALIGIGILVCGASASVAYKKARQLVNTLKQQRQTLLPVVKENPVLVRLPSKQFQMKQLLSYK